MNTKAEQDFNDDRLGNVRVQRNLEILLTITESKQAGAAISEEVKQNGDLHCKRLWTQKQVWLTTKILDLGETASKLVDAVLVTVPKKLYGPRNSATKIYQSVSWHGHFSYEERLVEWGVYALEFTRMRCLMLLQKVEHKTLQHRNRQFSP